MQARDALVFPDENLRRYFSAVMDALPFYVLLVDENHHILAWNEAMKHTFQVEDPAGLYCPKVIHGLDSPYHSCPLEDAVVAHEAIEKELFDGETGRWVSSAIYPTTLRSADNQRVYLHFTRDITDEKQSKERLAISVEHHKALGVLLQQLQKATTSEETLSTLVDVVLDLSWIDQTCGAGAFLSHADDLRLVYFRNLEREKPSQCARVPFGHCVCGTVAQQRQAIVTVPTETGRLNVIGHPHAGHGHATFPLVCEGKTLAVVNFYLRANTTLLDSQRDFLVAAVAVTAAALGEQTARESARAAEREIRELERRLFEKVVASQEDERKRVARELHDDLGQALSALLLDIKTMARADRTSTAEVCDRMDLAVRDLIGRVYTLAWDLRPSVLDDYGLDSALTRHIANLSKRTTTIVDYRFVTQGGEASRLPPGVEVLLYRVTQEAVNNALKHSEATRISIVVLHRETEVSLMVEDDGIGFDSEVLPAVSSKGGFGLVGLRERVSLLKGRLVIESSKGSGTSLRVTVPLAAPERASAPPHPELEGPEAAR